MVEFFCNPVPFLDIMEKLLGRRGAPPRPRSHHFPLIKIRVPTDTMAMKTTTPPHPAAPPSACRRRQPRFAVKEGGFAFDSGGFLGYLVDIGPGGVAFTTSAAAPPAAPAPTLTFCGDEGFCVANLPCQSVAEQQTTRQSFAGPVPAIRRSLSFSPLSAAQRQELELFIRQNARPGN